MKKELDPEVNKFAVAILACEIIRLKSLCYKASEHIRVEDDTSQNLYDALRFKTSADYSTEYDDLRAESETVEAELKEIFGPLFESYEQYIKWLEEHSKE
jgi:hypothetical protein